MKTNESSPAFSIASEDFDCNLENDVPFELVSASTTVVNLKTKK